MKRLLLLWTVLLTWACGARAAAPVVTSCLHCHADSSLFEGAARGVVAAFRQDVHASVGLSCQDCHGGNPDPRFGEDGNKAMDTRFAASPFHGAPARRDIPHLCGRCHGDLDFMRRYKPDARTDQETEYWTSNHGRALRTGDTAVATCVDCHGGHGILRPQDPRSPVYPTQVAETCRTCHADPKRMAGRRRADGSPLPVDQYDRWRRSVHATALLERGDLSAPTCNDCHGNHGARPPGVEAVAFVCGQCHGREAELFRQSPKHAKFEEHNALIADNHAQSCQACHSPPEPQAQVQGIHTFTECSTCHENHAVMRPTMALLGNLPQTPCAFCHEATAAAGTSTGETAEVHRHFTELRDSLLREAATQGLEGKARFDWLMERVVGLPVHTVAGSPQDKKPAELRPQFARLFQKFRIGRTTYAYFDPAQGKTVQAEIRSCAMCHPESPGTTGGLHTARVFLERMAGLTELTARAERTLLGAQRGGIEVKEGLLALDKAVDSQIELEVLVHTFSSDSSGLFVKKQAEGVRFANAAFSAGQQGFHELHQRRRGLYVSLVFIALALIAIGLRIRSQARGEDG